MCVCVYALNICLYDSSAIITGIAKITGLNFIFVKKSSFVLHLSQLTNETEIIALLPPRWIKIFSVNVFVYGGDSG